MASTPLPPGPRSPSAWQLLGWWTRPLPFFERSRRRYGRRFTIRLLGLPPFVILSDPDDIRAVFTQPPDVLHPGEGASILEPVVGRNSLILLDEQPHLEQRRLMLPAFHGERMARLTGLMSQVAEDAVAGWPQGTPVDLHPRFQALTLEVILRTVFGVDPGRRLRTLRVLLTELLEIATGPLSMVPFARVELGGRTPWARQQRLVAQTDALLYELIAERRAAGADREDVLAMLLAARHQDGSPMSDLELRDELMTLLVAGHETTASALAWTVERLTRTPRVLAELAAAAAGDDDRYLEATIQEVLRRRPVIPNAAPRLVKRPVTIGGWTYPAGVCLVPHAYLVHHDPEIYPDPYELRPERFLDEPPGTYTWIPFGGGRRRCIGASFAMLEMKVVLRALLRRHAPRAPSSARETARRRSITVSPRDGARVVLEPARAPAARAAARAPVAA